MATSADKIISIARAQIGTKATDIKKCKYNTWYYGGVVSGSGYDWCVTFVQWVFNEAGARSLLYTKTANCGVQAKAFQDKKRLVTSGFKKGDVVFFHWSNEPSTMVPGTYVSDGGLILQCLYAAGICPDVNSIDHARSVYENIAGYLGNDDRLGVAADTPEPGDLVFYGGASISHAAIYAGDGMIYDSSPGLGVTYRSYYSGGNILKIVRVF